MTSRRELLYLGLSLVAARDAASQEASRELVRARGQRYPGLDAEREGVWKGPFFFLQLADTQFGMFENNASWEKETELFTRAVGHINRLKPRFVIVCGDLVNQVPGGAAYEAQAREYKRIAAQIDPAVPLVCVCGNHDVGNRPSAATLSRYREDFGDDWFTFWTGGVCSVVLNSSLYSDPAGAPAEQERQEAWLRETLTAVRRLNPRHLFLFQHHPWFLAKPDEPDQYFNIPRVRRDPALALLRAAGVRAVFAGHYHRNAYGRDGEMEMVTTSAVGKPLGKDPSGFRAVRVFDNRIDHTYYGLDSVPERISLE